MTAQHKISPYENVYETIHDINMYLRGNPCPISMQAYETKTYMLIESINGEPLCM